MFLSKSLATILIQLADGDRIPASRLKGSLVSELMEEGILKEIRIGRAKSLLYVSNPPALNAFILNRFSIASLQDYISTLNLVDVTRAALTHVAANSKIKRLRTFTGFLVNSYEPIKATISQQEIEINPPVGTFQFIHDIKEFIPHPDVTIIGVENAENFSQIHRQKHLFEHIHGLFVCRYPQNQSKDLIKWLKTIPNPYLHFGDFDFAGIGIYMNEYKRHVETKAKFYVPDNIDALIKKFGNRAVYDNQKVNFELALVNEPQIHNLISTIHKYKKGLEQEALIPLL